MRLQKASEDLLSSFRTIAQISLIHGFADERSFINAFKKYYSTTPLQFRKKHDVKNCIQFPHLFVYNK